MGGRCKRSFTESKITLFINNKPILLPTRENGEFSLFLLVLVTNLNQSIQRSDEIADYDYMPTYPIIIDRLLGKFY